MSIRNWFLETRPQFLLLSLTLALHGSALSYWQSSFSWATLALVAVGLTLMHASVNVLNDWHDYRSGIDLKTRRTPFSGGSGFLPSRRLKPGEALALGLACLAAGSAIGFYLAWRQGWELLAIGAAGAVMVVAYTPVLSHLGVGEIAAGLGLGTLPIIGIYFAHSGVISPAAWMSAVPAGLLTFNLLLLNEFPDAEADVAGGRRHLVILCGKRAAGWIYAAAEIGAFVVIAASVIAGALTPWALLALLALAPALKGVAGALRDYDSYEKLIPAQGANVAAVLGMNALLAIGYFVAGLRGCRY